MIFIGFAWSDVLYRQHSEFQIYSFFPFYCKCFRNVETNTMAVFFMKKKYLFKVGLIAKKGLQDINCAGVKYNEWKFLRRLIFQFFQNCQYLHFWVPASLQSFCNQKKIIYSITCLNLIQTVKTNLDLNISYSR